MPESQSTKRLTEAVAVFDNGESLQDAVDELLSSGFNQAELSLLASEKAVEEKLGHAYRKVAELEDDVSVPRTAYVSTEARGDEEGGLIGGLVYVGAAAAAGAIVASGGALATVLASMAIAGGAGGLIGSFLAQLVGDHHARYIQEQLDHGGLLLWVRTRDNEHEQKAVSILKKHSAHDVHTHPIPSAGRAD